jgi:hypothetical protein
MAIRNASRTGGSGSTTTQARKYWDEKKHKLRFPAGVKGFIYAVMTAIVALIIGVVIFPLWLNTVTRKETPIATVEAVERATVPTGQFVMLFLMGVVILILWAFFTHTRDGFARRRPAKWPPVWGFALLLAMPIALWIFATAFPGTWGTWHGNELFWPMLMGLILAAGLAFARPRDPAGQLASIILLFLIVLAALSMINFSSVGRKVTGPPRAGIVTEGTIQIGRSWSEEIRVPINHELRWESTDSVAYELLTQAKDTIQFPRYSREHVRVPGRLARARFRVSDPTQDSVGIAYIISRVK